MRCRRAKRRLLVAVFLVVMLAAGAPTAASDDSEDWDLAQDPFGQPPFLFGGTVKLLGLGYWLPEWALGEESTEGRGLASFRMQLEGSPSEWLGYEVHIVTEADVHDDRFPVDLTGLTEATNVLFRGLGHGVTWDESDSHRLWSEVDYANISLTFRNADIVIGRQAVTFGSSFFWNPTDWLSTFSATEIDREYKAGVDAVRVSYGLGRFGGAGLVYAYGEDGEWDRSALIGRAFTNWRGWDLEVLGGSVLVDDRLGLAFAGDVGGAGLRGEASWHHPREGKESNFLRATVEVDYRWVSSLQLVAELHYNGWGTLETEQYAELFRSPRFITGQVSNVGRYYAGSQLSYEFTPLLVGSAAVLVNLHDGSGLVNPALTLSLSDESDLVLGSIIPWGAEPDGDELRSEYASYYTTVWVQWRWNF